MNYVRKGKTNNILYPLYVESKQDTGELIYKIEKTDTDIENKHMDTKRGRGGMNWEIEIDIYTLLCIK